ncbi:hypothetical protein [Spirosoma sp. 48-14]|uniref:hypothetical protein n=1 Tax=Spirosoma sp. 48-14 TaxID=1895854 RepID=UPI00095B7571|nr:hypothetical protein [Spirosoma sp. 48-14]OJW75670.1 MAG: hypothetical protein BGO59_08875 [Spirosoma sp. 48-14]
MEQIELITRLDALIKSNTNSERNRNNIASEIAKVYIKQTGAAISPALIRDIDQNYNKDGLQSLAKYARKVVETCQDLLDGLSLNLPYTLLKTMDLSTANKARLIWSVAFVFSDADVYRLFHNFLPTDIQKAAEQLTWLPRVSADVLGPLIGTKMTLKERDNHYYSGGTVKLISQFKLLPHKGEGWEGNVILEWPPHIRKFLQTAYPQPENYHIRTSSEPPAGLLRWEDGETIIFEDIQKLIAYRMQDSIPINNSGKVAANGLKKMRKLLGLREFFPDNADFPLVRTACLAQILAPYQPKKNQLAPDSLEALIQLRKTFEKHATVLFLLNDLKNHGFVSLYQYKQDAELALLEWMNRLPVGEWVSVTNILAYGQIHDLSVRPCHAGEYPSLVYETEAEVSWRAGSMDRRNVSSGNAYLFVERPALLGSFFLFASLGWLDIAYEAPTGKFASDYYSAYDGLRYVRLNALGASIFGRTKAPYVPKVNTATQELRFDEQSLLIFCDPEHVVAETILANYAERVSPTRFRVTPETFLKDCKTKQQLRAKVDLFCKSVAPNLPANWLTFFDELMSKADPLTSITDMTAYSIASTNQPLIRLLAQDPVLKSIVVKAEGFRILIATDNLPRFRSRLRELGYLI